MAHLVNLERGADRLVFTVPAPDASTAIPALDGGLHVIDADGTPHTYNSSGNPTTVVDTGWEDADIITLDPATGRLAIAAFADGVLIVNAATGETKPLPGVDSVGNLGFGRNGELLAITSFDARYGSGMSNVKSPPVLCGTARGHELAHRRGTTRTPSRSGWLHPENCCRSRSARNAGSNEPARSSATISLRKHGTAMSRVTTHGRQPVPEPTR